MNWVAIHQDVLAKVCFAVETSLVRWRWLVHWPIIKGWVNDRVLSLLLSKLNWFLLLLSEVNWVTINENILAKISFAIEAMLMWWRWLVHRPVVEWWVNHRVITLLLGKLNGFLLFLGEVNRMSINNYILTKISLTVQTLLVRRGWLVNRPIVKWWINYWVLGSSLDKVIVDTIKYHVPESEILSSLHTVLVRWRWLVHWPVVEGRINDRVLNLLLSKLNRLLLLLGEVNWVAINENILTKISFTIKAMLMWWRWLVHWPVVEWWIHNWVFSLRLYIGQLINANSNSIVKVVCLHLIFHQNWID